MQKCSNYENLIMQFYIIDSNVFLAIIVVYNV